MKLTKEQSQEIKDLQSQVNQTKRVTAPALENILYEAMPTLDHGFVRVVDYMSVCTDAITYRKIPFCYFNFLIINKYRWFGHKFFILLNRF